MGVMNVEPEKIRFDDLVAACRTFAECFTAFIACDAETRADIEELIAYARGEDVDESERESIFATIAQSLFPKFRSAAACADDLSAPASVEEMIAAEALDVEEEIFARRLAAAMESKGMTQIALAAATGVQQPAISMMLARSCRPQRRTVEKFAEALEVPVGSLWPAYGTETENQCQESSMSQTDPSFGS